MKSLGIYIKNIISWFKDYPSRLKSIRIQELPDELNSKKIYIVGEGKYLWYAAMICPCGCGEKLYMGLIPDQKSKWTVSVHFDGSVSLHPSIWRKVGCKSHFWVKNGKIIWYKTEIENLSL